MDFTGTTKILFLSFVLMASLGITIGCANSQFAKSLGFTWPSRGGAFEKASTPQAKCQVVVDWIRQVEVGMDDPQFFFKRREWGWGPVGPLTVHNLYRDEYFVPVFGASYDTLSALDRGKQMRKAEQVCINHPPDTSVFKPHSKKNPRLTPWNFYERVITPGNSRLLSYVGKARIIRQRVDQMIAEAKELPPTEESFGKIEQYLDNAKQDMAGFWPSERKPLLAALNKEQRRMAESALVARMDKAIATATDYPGLLNLDHFVKNNYKLFNLVGEELQKREKARMEKTLRDGLAPLLAEEWKALEARGTGLDALKHGTLWYNNFVKRYHDPFSPAIKQTIVKQTIIEFYALRRQDMAAAEDELTALLKRATTVEALDLLVAKHVGPHSYNDYDRKKYYDVWDGVEQVATLVETLQDTLMWETHLAKERWKYTEREIALMSSHGVIVVPPQYDPPSENEIRFAFLRAVVSSGGRMVSKHKVTVPLKSPMEAAMDLLPGLPAFAPRVRGPEYPIEIRRVVKPDCSASQSGGYTCQYQVLLKMGRNVGKVVGPDHFELTPNGWSSDTLSRKVGQIIARGSYEVWKGVAEATDMLMDR